MKRLTVLLITCSFFSIHTMAQTFGQRVKDRATNDAGVKVDQKVDNTVDYCAGNSSGYTQACATT